MYMGGASGEGGVKTEEWRRGETKERRRWYDDRRRRHGMGWEECVRTNQSIWIYSYKFVKITSGVGQRH